ncbi:hypothetical protein [Micromonospora echinospora]|uniref:hypothetical protein n=1 Tax=Micromonospora echinospora TaxID=1877 RepID=UPI001E344401|nr:hypothetical protein [Micromonospora echinospora]
MIITGGVAACAGLAAAKAPPTAKASADIMLIHRLVKLSPWAGSDEPKNLITGKSTVESRGPERNDKGPAPLRQRGRT